MKNIYTNKNDILIKPLSKKDISLVDSWLNKEYIKKWFGDPKEWLEEIIDINGEYNWINHFIVYHREKSIGFCQYFDCSKTAKGFEWDEEEAGTFAIGYLIGDQQYLGKGLGTIMIEKIINLIIDTENPYQIIADPLKDNIKSIKLLMKNNFIFDEKTCLYKLKISEKG